MRCTGSQAESLHTSLTSTFTAWLPVPWWRARAAQRSATKSLFDTCSATAALSVPEAATYRPRGSLHESPRGSSAAAPKRALRAIDVSACPRSWAGPAVRAACGGNLEPPLVAALSVRLMAPPIECLSTAASAHSAAWPAASTWWPTRERDWQPELGIVFIAGQACGSVRLVRSVSAVTAHGDRGSERSSTQRRCV
jgi:hypothetical protein